MPRPIAVCIEDVAAGTFISCVALVGGESGLPGDKTD